MTVAKEGFKVVDFGDVAVPAHLIQYIEKGDKGTAVVVHLSNDERTWSKSKLTYDQAVERINKVVA